MHGLGFKDEQARSVKDQVVVTVEVHEPRNLGESPNSPPIVPPWTRDLPQPEFMEDLQRSHSLGARLSGILCSTTVSLASAEVIHVDGAAVHCDAAQVTPGEAAPKKVPTSSKRFPSDDEEPANTARLQDFKNPLKISSASMWRSSSHSSITDEKLDTATIDSSWIAASRTDSGIAVMTADVAKRSSDVASTCVMPYGKILVSFTTMKSTSTDSDDTSRETARAALVLSDSDEGSIPPSGSVSLSFVSSNSSSDPVYRVTDLADLPRLQNNVVAANSETGDGCVVLRLPLPRLTSSATQTVSSRQPASSLTERGTQAQEIPEWPCRSGWPLLLKTRRCDIVPRGTTDRPWTEDIRNIVMQGNKNYLHQHARRRHLAKSATTLDETQCVLFKLTDEVQPDATSSSVAPVVIWSTSMSSEFTREGCESTQEHRRNTVSSVRDVRSVASDSSFEQPLKLTELILLQHPEVGLRGFFPFDHRGATNDQDGAKRYGMSLEPNTMLDPPLQLNTVQEDSTVGPICGEKMHHRLVSKSCRPRARTGARRGK
ncbi:hypothetical protein HPB50_024286 [Hyalomma asiaticum]|uniref:Uncharacterized protein n=1 Tax=Hyalomma asiaticum TaxID=266040 RepID=A0ACB7S2C3_HYAAI|nr:hypothetical protein HPB50_024286 [Hyalomma asiaticum]